MRLKVTLGILLMWLIWTNGQAQPANDDCFNAQFINVNTPAACPSTTPATTTVNGTNVDATPIVPYPSFNGCGFGGQPNPSAAEVWYVFIAKANITEIRVNGLNQPSIVFFRGEDCTFLNPENCASANPGAGTVTATFATLAGLRYYVMVAGGDVNDQGNFTLQIRSYNNCNPCLIANTFTVSPPPLNGTYSSGQQVTFCYTVEDWDVTGTIEWLHALTVEFGPGWDLSTLNPQPPAACTNGSWNWYESWVSCNNPQMFGPGFAFDSGSGVGCGGSPFDGNPGNNWGDPCQEPGGGDFPITFCWSVNVSTCPAISTGADLSMTVNIWSDGDSGSWTQTGCNSGFSYDFLATAVCCDDANPVAIPTPTTCPTINDGSVEVIGGDPASTYQFYIFDLAGNQIGTVTAQGSTIWGDDEPGLASGQYSVLAVNVASGCTRSSSFTIGEGNPPDAAVLPSDPEACPGGTFTLTGLTTTPGTTIQYNWTGPGGPYSGETITVSQQGTYQLIITVDGCPSDPVPVQTRFVDLLVQAEASTLAACPGDEVTLTALTNSAISFDWEDITNNIPVGSGSVITIQPAATTTYRVTATDSNGCTAEDEITITVNPLPDLSFDILGNTCAGSTFSVRINGANAVIWDNGNTNNPRVFDNLPAGNYSYVVQGTNTTTGCSAELNVDFIVFPPPVVNILTSDPDNVVCTGTVVSLEAVSSTGNSYSWTTTDQTAEINVSPNATTTYTVTVTDFDGCTNTANVTLQVEQPLAAPNITCGNITPSSVTFTWAPVTGATGYNVTVNSGPTGTLNGTNYTVTGLSPNQTVSITVTALSGTSCPNSSATASCTSQDCPPVTVDIAPVPDICLGPATPVQNLQVAVSATGGTGAWSGPGVTNAANGTFDPNTAGTGQHQVIYAYTQGQCIYRDTVLINVRPTPTAIFTLSDNEVCTGEGVTLTYTGNAGPGATYTWDFGGGNASPGTGAGPHQVSWTTAGTKTVRLTVTENGCVSATEETTINVAAPLVAPVLNCGPSTTTSVTFNWTAVAGATGYAVNVLTGQTGTLTGTTYTVNNLSPQDTVTIQVTALGNGPCPDPTSAPLTCNAAACPDFTINITPLADICLGSAGPRTLNATVSGGQGNGTLSWSGAGVTGSSFDPLAAGTGSHRLYATYTEGPCSETDSILVNVFNTPMAAFSAGQDTVCVNESVVLNFTGTVDDPASVTFTWNFNGGTANPVTGPGPITVQWATAGTKNISLTVTENGCSSTSFALPVTVQQPLAAPVINCNTSTSEIVFTWSNVAGATDYIVTVLQGPMGTRNANSYTVSGLSPGNQVEIRVEAVSGTACPNSTNTASCVAEVCPPVTVTIDNVSPVCLDANAGPLNLVDQIGGGSGGTTTWSGFGIVDAQNGVFDPNAVGAGTHTVTATYQQGNCSYSASADIQVNAQPVARFTADPLICVDETSTVTFNGNAGPGAAFNWGFDGGTADSGTDGGPYEIRWATGGNKTVTLTVTENNCASEPFAAQVEVQEPIPAPALTCTSTNTSVTFTWDPVPGASAYQIIDTSGVGTYDIQNNVYNIDGLNPGDELTIQVIAETGNACGNTVAEATCVASDCLPVVLDIPAIAPVCADAGLINLSASASGGLGGGTYSWSGPGIVDSSGVFDPALVTPGIVNLDLIYREGVCSYSGAVSVTVKAVPVAAFGLTTPVCVGEEALITFTGTASSGGAVIYNWNFASGTVVSGSGAGPYRISWATPGSKNITLQIDDNGCLSNAASGTLQVEAPLATPVVSCQSTTNTSITFAWAPVAGAVDYQVEVLNGGPAGVLNGTTYALTGLTPNQEVTIRVTAIGSGVCGNSAPGEATCVANDCPGVSLTVSAPQAICRGDAAAAQFDFSGPGSGPYEVTYSLNGGPQQTITVPDGGALPLDGLTQSVSVAIISYLDVSLRDCVYPGNTTLNITVSEPVDAGQALDPARICAGDARVIDLAGLISGSSGGGVWSVTTGAPPTGFDPAQGILNTAGLPAGDYTFRYFIDAGDPCPDDAVEVKVIAEPAPVADAGIDQQLTCNMGMVSLGGSATTAGPGISYLWTSDDPSIVITDPTRALIDVSQPATYTLTVRNELGCSDSDEVVVSSDLAAPIAEIAVSKISCFKANDGAITVTNVTGGTPPYTFSLNDGLFSSQRQFAFLGPSTYRLVVRDGNGCFSEVSINLAEPDELVVTLVTNLEGDNIIQAGDSVLLTAVFNPGVVLDTIIWQPDTLAGPGNPTSISVMPTATTRFSVTIIDENGCSDDDGLTLFVRKVRPVFIPNAFSPNEDGSNDVFFVQARDNAVKQIKSFLVFNRWGETMMELYNFQPNDPVYGWDGTHRGRLMNPGVYVYLVEIEFSDGEVIRYQGDVALMR